MNALRDKNHFPSDLEVDDKIHITELFFEEIVPKLVKLNARIGTINCEFAGEKYKDWNIYFRSAGSGFEIIEFEFDEDGSGMDLDL